MERLKHPDEESNNYPIFYCSSISDMAASRDAMIEEMLAWGRNEARGMDRVFLRASDRLDVISSKIAGRKIMSPLQVFVSLALITHYPAIDEELQLPSKQILIKDPTGQCVVELPGVVDLAGINFFRRRADLPLLDLKSIRDRSWTADIMLFNKYSSESDRFNIILVDDIEMEEEIKAEETVLFKSPLVLPQGI